MSSTKRNRGRPLGTGLDDSPALGKVADMLAVAPSLKPTTAFKRALDKPTETAVRRLQGKWKDEGAKYLADAKVRRAAVPAPARRSSAPYSPRTARQVFEAHRRMQDALSPAMRAAHEMMNSPAMLAAQEAARRLHESPAMRAIEELRNSPTMRAIEELHNSPTMRAMRELQESPTMRAINEAHAQMRLLSGY
ncbi:hypothetical protein AV944_18110 (plasmid) [Sphingomonas sp. LK11]|uniref:hypothetical protein n=1 Tax=Sphingomonas sp. LK11 TaxID=1390395 RepID=UPI000972C23B|nr:hypothetical protein [Sphingomonas sp. LK11]APX67933.1 hypothetical protein AV944_18110 [Sphingomonas sp. LK11]